MKISKNPIMNIIKVRINEEKSHILYADAEGIIYDIISLEGIHKNITIKITGDGPIVKIWPYKLNDSTILIILN
jgi:hypothetical protein